MQSPRGAERRPEFPRMRPLVYRKVVSGKASPHFGESLPGNAQVVDPGIGQRPGPQQSTPKRSAKPAL
jgi:hypothetical protein